MTEHGLMSVPAPAGTNATTGRPSASATSEPVRCTTKIFSTDGVCCTASSALAFIGISSFVPRTPVSWVMMALHSESLMRVTRLSALNAPNTIECTAPIRAQASMAIDSSGIICM